MKKAIVEFSQEYWHLTVAFEIAIKELEQGHTVYFYDFSQQAKCNTHYRYANQKLQHLLPKLFTIRRLALKIKSVYGEKFIFISASSMRNVESLDLSEEIIYDAVYKELVSELKLPMVDFSNHQNLVDRKTQAFIETYSFFVAEFRDKKIDQVFTNNGRFLHERAVWEAANEVGLKISFHERFVLNWSEKYWIFDSSVHDTKYRAQVVERFNIERKKHTSEFTDENSEISMRWYQNRKNALTQDFTKLQSSSFRKKDPSKILVTFFTSSEDELIYSNLQSHEWPNQISSISKVASIIKNYPNIEMIVRIHPNLANKAFEVKNEWELLCAQYACQKNVTFISYDNPIRSYDLLEQSDLIITAGSTLGVEAAVIGKPSLLLGKALHDEMGICHQPMSEANLEDYLVNRVTDNTGSHVEASHRYVSFLELGGVPFVYAKKKKTKADFYSQDPQFIFYERFNLKPGILLRSLNSFLNFLSKERFEGL